MSKPSSRQLLVLALIISSVAAAPAAGEFLTQPSWQVPTAAAAEALLESYLLSAEISPDRQAAARETWRDQGSGEIELLDRVANALAKSDDRVAELVEHCATASQPGPLPEFDWLADSATPIIVSRNMRLYLARWLVQNGYYDEAISWTDGLAPDEVVAPGALLFYRAVAHHRLVEADEADAALARLLQREDDLPARYQKLAALMRQDLAALQNESLDHIARRMEDIRRRLAQGRAGERVQGLESGVIESLDKIIDKIEQQLQQQQQQAQASSSGGRQSNTPMEESRIAELKGPGKVEPRDIGRGTGWGNLPDKDREKALQEIGREFPSHYREVIEEYFRRLASEESGESR